MQKADMLQALLFAVVALCFISGGVSMRFQARAVLTAIGYFAIPFYVMSCSRRCLVRRVGHVFTVLWLVHVGHCLQQLAVDAQVVGIAGNRNWMAALALALTPWPWYSVHKLTIDRCPRVRRAFLATVGALSGVATVMVLYHGSSRAAWLAGGVYLVLFIGIGSLRSIKHRVAVLLVLAGVMAGLVIYYYGSIQRAIEEDIRLPLWRQTLVLVADHPWLGVGPGNFRREFPRYRSPAHTRRRVAGAVTEHPHNQLLHMAAILGVPLALLWCVLLFPLFKRPGPGYFWWYVHFSAFILIFHSCFDTTLVRPPTSLLGLILLGLLWRRHVAGRLEGHWPHRPLRWSTCVVRWAFVGLALFWGGQQMAADWFFRKGVLLRSRRLPRQAYAAFATASEIQPRLLRAHGYAGRLAAESLGKPRAALSHFAAVREEEPYFGHINAEIGLALGNMGKHGQALSFFECDAQLFPHDSFAQSRLIRAKILVNDRHNVGQIVDRLRAARWHTLRMAYGEDTAKGIIQSWYAAVGRSDTETALRLAAALARPFSVQSPAEPGIKQALDSQEAAEVHCTWHFDQLDVAVWDRNHRWSEFVAPYSGGSLEDLVAAVLVSGDSGGVDIRDQVPKAFDGYPEYTLAGILRQSGYEVGLVADQHKRSTGILEVRTGKRVWLVSALTNRLAIGRDWRDLEQDGQLRQDLGLACHGDHVLRLVLPVDRNAFCMRNQIVDDLLREGISSKAFRVAESPTLCLWRYEALLAAVGDAESIPSISLSLLPASP
ncbi:MAG: O-antigen ligase family protein [Candidatus Pacebacteria bacterium]|nr:O-antigen ligase family protein [Candidatus Paceibacterota bacterium]